jgi:hypothetical protein
MLHYDSNQRITFEEILHLPIITKVWAADSTRSDGRLGLPEMPFE